MLYEVITDVEPRATEHIADMIAMIEALIEKGFAYEADVSPGSGHMPDPYLV